MSRRTRPIPWEKKSTTGARSASKSMPKRLHHRKGFVPLPVKDGLNPTRVRLPEDGPAMRAEDFVGAVIAKQRHKHPLDDAHALHQRFSDGKVVLRDQTALTPDSLVQPGQDVWFYRMPAPERPVPYRIRTVYEDEDLLVVDKPPFLATMPRGAHITETVTVRLRRATGRDELTPAHRLDRLTSGLLLLTKRRSVRGAYQTMFAERRVDKMYEAVAPRRAWQAPQRWESRLSKVPGQLQGTVEPGEPNTVTKLLAVKEVPGEAQLQARYRTTEPLARYVLRPVTGRTHQLRLQMWEAGVPILGDPIYPRILPAEDEDFSEPLQLRAVSLAFADPLTGERRRFS